MGRFIVRGTNPTVTITNSNQQLDLRLLGTPSVSIDQDHREMFFADVTVSEHTLTFRMTQQQTLSLEAGTENRPKTARVQYHFVKNGVRGESRFAYLPVYDTNHNEVIA